MGTRVNIYLANGEMFDSIKNGLAIENETENKILVFSFKSGCSECIYKFLKTMCEISNQIIDGEDVQIINLSFN